MTGGGGWPMSVWLTPDLKPFVGATYFAPEDQGGRPGFRTILSHISKQVWLMQWLDIQFVCDISWKLKKVQQPRNVI